MPSIKVVNVESEGSVVAIVKLSQEDRAHLKDVRQRAAESANATSAADVQAIDRILNAASRPVGHPQVIVDIRGGSHEVARNTRGLTMLVRDHDNNDESGNPQKSYYRGGLVSSDERKPVQPDEGAEVAA
jgi:hypothetical protein